MHPRTLSGPRRHLRGRAGWILLLVLAAAAVFVALRLRGGDEPAGEPTREAAPGATVDEATVLAPLSSADWTKIDDPASDGWETEVQSEQAKQALAVLGEWVRGTQSFDEATVASILADDFRCAALAPREPETVFEDPIFRVQRWVGSTTDGPGPAGDGPGPAGPAALVAELERLSAPWTDPEHTYAKLKPFKIFQEGDDIVTRQHVSFSGPTDDGILEQHSIWTAYWKPNAAGDGLLLSGLACEDFEQSLLRGLGHTLFTDCTRSALGGNASYGDQLLFGFAHWARRIAERQYFALLGTTPVAVADIDNDGLEDLYLGQQAGLPNRLFVQQRDGTAVDVSAERKLDWIDSTRGVIFVDLDNDGDQDMVSSTLSNVIVLANDGTGHFEQRAILQTNDDTLSLSAADYDLDGDLDLYVCVYFANDATFQAQDSFVPGLAAVSGGFVFHDATNGGPNHLFRNDGDFRFEDVTYSCGIDMNNARYSFASAWEDFDNDGDQDLYVANDYGRNNFYRNDGGRFTDIAGPAGVEDRAGSMGVTWGDYDRDGWMDVYVSNMWSSAGNRIAYQERFKEDAGEEVREHLQRFARGNSLFRNRGDGTFEDVTLEANVNMARWAWGTNFVDLNNDGLQDILVANGYITTDDTGDL